MNISPLKIVYVEVCEMNVCSKGISLRGKNMLQGKKPSYHLNNNLWSLHRTEKNKIFLTLNTTLTLTFHC